MRKHLSISKRSFSSVTLNEKSIQTVLESIARPTSPHDPDFTREGYLSYSFLSKFANPSKESSKIRSDQAVIKLLATENRNNQTIKRLETNRDIHGVSTSSLLYTASRFIKSVLGPLDYNIFASAGFSNGASTSRKRVNSDAVQKFDGKGDITLSALPYFNAFLATSQSYRREVTKATFELGRDPIRIVEGNVVFTVPKSDIIDRAAAKEPDLNMFLQRACGNHIRQRLRTVGIDLNDQSVNQELARIASIDGSLATLDLSSASDSVTWKLCLELLPFDWYSMLTDLRSERGLVNGKWHEWVLMSTMGNGYTFELESLIFWALTRSVCYHFGHQGSISVYGDDIICPTASAPALIELLEYCGFLVNPEKSFTSGPFRESCGAHWYAGMDVKPFYCKSPLSNMTRCIWFLNRLRQWSSCGGVCDPRYEELYFSSFSPELDKFSGWDLESITAVARPIAQRFKLHEATKRQRRASKSYALTAWLSMASSRLSGCQEGNGLNELVTSFRSDPIGDWQMRSNTQFGTIDDVPFFLREM